MAGGQGDSGGNNLQEFLGDVSLLTMIDRVRSKTRLAFYEDRLRSLYAGVTKKLDETNIVISNEMESWLWRVAWRASRICDRDHLNQFVHPIADAMQQRSIRYKGRRLEKYRLHPSFERVGRLSKFEYYPIPRP